MWGGLNRRMSLLSSDFNSLWKISSETYVIQTNSLHPTLPLKSNDKRAALTKIRFCCCNTQTSRVWPKPEFKTKVLDCEVDWIAEWNRSPQVCVPLCSLSLPLCLSVYLSDTLCLSAVPVSETGGTLVLVPLVWLWALWCDLARNATAREIVKLIIVKLELNCVVCCILLLSATVTLHCCKECVCLNSNWWLNRNRMQNWDWCLNRANG